LSAVLRCGKQLGEDDERNLFPQAIRLIAEARPVAVMIENVRGFLDAIFADYRKYLAGQFTTIAA
jgi:DNA (cytosine-5)-methyltransferase 1